jgi:hypothetical protein
VQASTEPELKECIRNILAEMQNKLEIEPELTEISKTIPKSANEKGVELFQACQVL